MKSYIAIVLLFTFFFGFTTTRADEDNTDAIYLSVKKEYVLKKDGTIEYNESKALKLLTHYSFHRLFGETFIIYNPDYQDLKINEAYTIMADGKKVVTPENAFNLVLPRFANHAPAYNNLREMVVTHTGLEVGAVIHLDYTLTTSNAAYPYLMVDEQLNTSVPVKEKIITVKVPKDVPFNHKVFNIRTAPEITEKDGMIVYTWTFNNLDQYTGEWHQPANHTDRPRLVFSTAKNFYSGLYPFLEQNAFKYAPCKGIKELVFTTQDKEKNELKQLMAFQNKVVNEINSYGVTLDYANFKTRTPVETWQSNGGTELEKTLLLTTIMRNAGFSANPVAVIPAKLYSPEVGNLNGITGFLVRVSTKEYGVIYLSATSTDTKDQWLTNPHNTFILLDPNMESVKTFTPGDIPAKITVSGNFILNADTSLSGMLNVSLEGAANPFFSLMNDESAVNKIITGISSKEIETVENINITQKNSSYSLSVNSKNAFREYGDMISAFLPAAADGFNSWGINFLYDERETPFMIPSSLSESYNITLKLPENWVLVTPENEVSASNGLGSVLIAIKQKGTTVTINKTLTLNESIIKPIHYQDFKELIDPWLNPVLKKLVFKENN